MSSRSNWSCPMTRARNPWSALLILVLGCGSAVAADSTATASAADAAQATRVDADTPRATAAGATFTVPAGWSARSAERMVVLEPPEADLRVALVDVDAKDADSAVAAGWKVYQ